MALSDLLKTRGETVKYEPKTVDKQNYKWYNTVIDSESKTGILTKGMLQRMVETTSFKTKVVDGDTYIYLPDEVVEEYEVKPSMTDVAYQLFVEDLCERARIPRLD